MIVPFCLLEYERVKQNRSCCSLHVKAAFYSLASTKVKPYVALISTFYKRDYFFKDETYNEKNDIKGGGE